MTNLDAYRLPPELVAGTWVEVPGTDVAFKCVLPSRYNEDFQIAWLSRLGQHDVKRDPETGEMLGAGAALIIPTQRDAFLATCVLETTGLPEDAPTPEEFARLYRPAFDKVMASAMTLGTAVDQKIDDAVGNLKPFSNGSASGKGAPKNTPSAKRKAPSRKATSAPH